MSLDRDDPRRAPAHRRRLQRTVATLATVAALIYLGFIARGVFGS
ncbi:MAG: hypothetical protein RQ729_02045 [Wenzhouxiangellaceae bacterium]|nr:hypothetical protein [Wenzhouxiangellaceae bacterium]